jgi:Ca2+-binding RTX toxin-like protein
MIWLLVAIGLLFAATPGQGRAAISCEYVEAGPPGPAGNVLQIDDRSNGVTHVYREDDAIVVFSNFDREPTECGGVQATVLNVDRIDLTTNSAPFINYHGDGALAPGASPEQSGPEIEIAVREPGRERVLNLGSRGGVAGQLGSGGLGVNFNPQADGNARDVDVTFPTAGAGEVVLKLVGTPSSERFSVLGGPEFKGPTHLDSTLMAGGPGDDTLIGGPYRDRLSGGEGDDVLRGGRGRDNLTIGPGRDLADAGKGPDDIFNVSDVGGTPEDLAPDRVKAGPGNDRIDVEQLLGGDRVDCGPGRHDSAFIDTHDRATGCERTSTARASSSPAGRGR